MESKCMHVNEQVHSDIETSNREKTLPRSSAVQKGVQTVRIERREGAAMMGGAAVMDRCCWLWQHLCRRCRECRGVSRCVRTSTVQRRAQTSRLERRRHRDDGRCRGDGEGGFGRRIGPVVKEGRPRKAPTSWLMFVVERSGDEWGERGWWVVSRRGISR